MKHTKLHWCVLLSFLSLSCASNCLAQSVNSRLLLDSLLSQLKDNHTVGTQYQQDSSTVMLLNELSYAYRNTNHDSAVYFANQGLEASEVIAFNYGSGLSSIRLASAYQKKGQFDKALSILAEALPLLSEVGDGELLGKAYLTQGITYKKKGDYPKAIASYSNSLDHYTSKPKQAKVFNNMAIVYSLLKDYDNAEAYFLDALEIYKETNNEAQIARSYRNLSIAYTEKGNLSKARDYLQLCLDIEAVSPNKLRAAQLRMEIGFIDEKEQDYAAAKSNYEKALAQFEQLDQQTELVYCQQSLALVYGKLNQSDKAREFFKKSLAGAKALEMADLMQVIYFNHSNFEFEEQRFDVAHDLLQKHLAIKDTLLTAAKNEQIAKLREEYESEKKERAIVQLEQEKELASVKLDRQKQEISLRNIILGAAALLVLLFVVLLFNYRKREKQTKLLAQKNEKLLQEETLRLLKDQEMEQFEALMALQASERQRIAADLHDRLGNDLATVKLYFDTLDSKVNITDEESREYYQKANELLANVCEEARQIAHNIASGMLAELGLVHAVKDLVAVIERSGALKLSVSAMELNRRLPEQVEIKLYRSIQELITNILRHSDASKATIQFTFHEDSLNIMIEDDGKGFLWDKSDQVGMGLHSIAKRMATLNGEMDVDSGKGTGTTIILNMPLPT